LLNSLALEPVTDLFFVARAGADCVSLKMVYLVYLVGLVYLVDL